MANESILRNKSLNFAVRIVKFYKYLRESKQEFIISKQIMRSGTSIGANIAEAQGTQSDADFVAKLHIALKEAFETVYWLELLKLSEYVAEQEFSSLKSDIEELKALLISSLRTTKTRMNS